MSNNETLMPSDKGDGKEIDTQEVSKEDNDEIQAEDNSKTATNDQCTSVTSLEPLSHGQCIAGRSSPTGHENVNSVSDSIQCSHQWDNAKQLPPNIFTEEGGGDGLAVVNSDDDDHYVARTDRNWPTSLRQLLEDPDGSAIFRKFIEDKTQFTDMLTFWYACNGLRLQDHSQRPDMISVIWRNYLQRKRVKISSDTYRYIRGKIDCREFCSNIFDRAQMEVEEKMNETVYLCFLESEEYASWLLANKHDNISPSSPTCGASEPYMGLNVLPTLSEDVEFNVCPQKELPQSRRTSNNLLHAASHRASDMRKANVDEGYCLNSTAPNLNTYHYFPAGHAISLQDSEIQSLSSGAPTDETCSYSSSSRSNSHSHRFSSGRQFQKIRQQAKQNPETPEAVSIVNNTYVIPRTMREAGPSAVDPVVLAEQLKILQQKQESNEKFKQSFCKIVHTEENSEEAKREHAVNALPPHELTTKLFEKTVPVEDDPSQSILDNHVARVWDSPNTPGSPKPKSPPKLSHNASHFADLTLPSTSIPSQVPYKPLRHMGMMANVFRNSSRRDHVSHGCDTKRVGARSHHERKERDVNSTFSSDSGNVADYHDMDSKVARMPKSKSMPEYMAHPLGASSDSTMASFHRQQYMKRSRRPAADLTDSGVSVVSDVPTPVPSVERVTTWLMNSTRKQSLGGTYSMSPMEKVDKGSGPRSVHTVAGLSSPRHERLSRRNDGIMPSNSCAAMSTIMDSHRNTPSAKEIHHYTTSDKRKYRGGLFCRSYSSGSVVGDSSSNGSTLKKQQKQSKNEFPGQLPTPNAGPSRVPVQQQSSVQIIYNFYGEVPYVVKLPTQQVTFRKYKQHLPKKGNYRYYFKKRCEDIGDIDVVYEEVWDDSEILPLFDGNIHSQIRKND